MNPEKKYLPPSLATAVAIQNLYLSHKTILLSLFTMKNLLEHTRRPDISFQRNGTIRIAARVARLLSLSPGDAINIAVSNGEYLLYVIRHQPDSIGNFEAQCYSSKRGSQNLCANSVRLCRSLLLSVGCTADKVTFNVGTPFKKNAITYLPIITLKPL